MRVEKGESKGIVTQKHHIFSLQTPTNSLQLIFHKHDTFFTAKNPHFSSTARFADPLKILMHIGWYIIFTFSLLGCIFALPID